MYTQTSVKQLASGTVHTSNSSRLAKQVMSQRSIPPQLLSESPPCPTVNHTVFSCRLLDTVQQLSLHFSSPEASGEQTREWGEFFQPSLQTHLLSLFLRQTGVCVCVCMRMCVHLCMYSDTTCDVHNHNALRLTINFLAHNMIILQSVLVILVWRTRPSP